MANTSSAKKAIRSSQRKMRHNLYWKNKIKSATKSIRYAVGSKGQKGAKLNEQLTLLQKVLDKAAKEKVIHKNKANRLKSRYVRKVAVHLEKTSPKGAKKAKKG